MKKYEDFLEVGKQLVLEAGKKVMDLSNDYSFEIKEDGTIVKIADKESNQILVSGWKRQFPAHGILSEESKDDKSRLNCRYVAIFDPLDGTKSYQYDVGKPFTEKRKDYAVMFGLAEEGLIKVGIVYCPANGKMYWATSDIDTAFLQQDGLTTELHVSKRTIDDAVMILSRKDFSPESFAQFQEQFGVKKAIQSGSFGVKACLIAEGEADAYVNSSIRAAEWDAAGPSLILQKAGGCVTDFDAKPIRFNQASPYLPRGAVCTNGKIHLEITSSACTHMSIK